MIRRRYYIIMVIQVCIGSSCHLKGSRSVILDLQELIQKHQLEDKINLTGSFCTGQCQKGVCVKLDKEIFSLSPDTTEEFFNKEVLGRLG